MRRAACWMAAALVAVAGCGKKADPTSEFTPQFTQTTLAAGSTGAAMTDLATKYSIPLYPGANPDTSHFSATANMGARVYLAYVTKDQPDKVVSFYKGQMGLGATTSGAVTILSGATRNGSGITINVGQKMDGSGTSFSIVISPAVEQRYDDSMASNPQTVASGTPNAPNPVPPQPAPKEYQDNTTYYIPTDRAEENNTDEGYQDEGTGGETTEYQDQGEITQSDTTPPGG